MDAGKLFDWREIPLYTEAYAKRSRMMRSDILRKLKKDYGIDPDIVKVDPRTVEFIHDPLYRFEDKIRDRIDRAAVHSETTLSEVQTKE